MTPTFDAVILAGGEGRRLGRVDKALVDIGGSTMLNRVLDAVADADRIVCVGPERPTSVPVVWTREDPPGGGPTPALAAGLQKVTSPVVVVLAVDVPLVTRDVVRALVERCDHAVLAADKDGVPQPLIAAYDAGSLRARLATMGTLLGVPITKVVSGMDVTSFDAPEAAMDCDTWSEVESARKGVLGA